MHVFDPTRKYLRVSTLENHSSSITAVRFSRDGTQLLSCGGDRALVLSAVDGKKVRCVLSLSVGGVCVWWRLEWVPFHHRSSSELLNLLLDATQSVCFLSKFLLAYSVSINGCIIQLPCIRCAA